MQQRQFKWLLKLETKDQTIKGTVGQDKKNGDLALNKTKWQGIEASKWKELSKSQGRSVYKLAIKSEWEEQEREINSKTSARGALGLVKVSWGQEGYLRGRAGSDEARITIEDSEKVWLIIAKGKNSIYLIPAVRSSTKEKDSAVKGKLEKDEDGEKILKEGVKDLGKWAQEFDESGIWEKERNAQLQKLFSSGFGVVRLGSLFNEGGEEEMRVEERKIVCYKGKQERATENGSGCQGINGGVNLYQNAGTLVGIEKDKGCEKCKQNEKYFPLDIAVLGEQSKMKELRNSYKGLIQVVGINDNITQVIGVRLDQVVISETGIGDGKGNKFFKK